MCLKSTLLAAALFLGCLAGAEAGHLRSLKSGGFGNMGSGLRFGFAGTLPARQQEALDAMSSIEAVARGERRTPHIHAQRPTSMLEPDSQQPQGPDRRLQQDGAGAKLGEFSKRTINLASQGTVAATLIRRAAEGRMQVADAITYTRPSRTQDSLALLAVADAAGDEPQLGRK